jgi:hypothetical protein
MSDDKKLSLTMASVKVGLPESTLLSLYRSGFLEACDTIGSTPIFRESALEKISSLRKQYHDPVQESIRVRKDAIDRARLLAQDQLNALQKECKHPNAVKENKSNTGNWDRGDDCYWKDCKCPDCGRVWMEDQ